jgi:putative endopeptidase
MKFFGLVPVRVTGCLVAMMLPAISHADSPAPFFPPFGIDLPALDKTTRSQDDFFQYENGTWLANTAIPPDQASVSMGRDDFNRVEKRLRALLEAAAAAAPAKPGTVEQKAGAMYAAFMDEAHIDQLGVTPIQARLDAIKSVSDKTDLARRMGESNFDFGGAVFSVSPDVDLKDPKRYVIYLSQAGLGLPDRDYYLDASFATQKKAYRAYIEQILTLIAWDQPAKSADAILDFETKIAKASWTKAEQRDLAKNYNPTSLADLDKAAPGFPWDAFLAASKLGDRTQLVVDEKTAFPKIAALYAAAPLDVLKAWEAFNVADSAAPDLSTPFQQASFAFHDKVLGGQAEIQPRWKRALAAVSGGDCGVSPRDCFGTLNWAVGQIYAAHDFTPETKVKVQLLVTHLIAAFRERLQKLDWMGPATKAEALKKLDTYTVKVGYPDHPRDYSKVAIDRNDLIGDIRHAAEADWDFYIQRSTGPVDRSDWVMTPQTADAYNGNLRDIVFPAAILQPPEFDPAADDAVNYGTIGSIIGHELTHGFDDQGRAVDAAGALRDWWTPEDAAAFKVRAAVLGKQFAAFQPVPGLHINPDLTMGENIADLGGLLIALDAYHASLDGKPAPVLDGYTGDQRFFMAYAQSWRGKAREDAIRRQTVSDPHSYRKFRVLGPLPNVDGWYDAFGVKQGDKMYRAPGDRVRLW